MHWWSKLDSETKTDVCFFYFFGLDGLKNFIIQDDKKVIEKVLFGTEQMTSTDLNACKNLSKKELDALSDTATNFIQIFSYMLKLHDFANIWMVENRAQDLNSITCGVFQICLNENLFNPNENSKIQGKR